jgi:hypothetical protein
VEQPEELRHNALKEVTVKRLALSLLIIALVPTVAAATWSVIAVDKSTGQVIIASATCVPQARFPPRPSRESQALS